MKSIVYALAFTMLALSSTAQNQQETNKQFQNVRTFISPAGFAIPKGVTRVKIEAWGAGGGGTVMGGGGGGAYGMTIVEVTEGNSLILQPGTGGSGSLTGGNNGQHTVVSYKSNTGAVVLLKVEGGEGYNNSSGSGRAGAGGKTVEGKDGAFFFLPGQDGTSYEDFPRSSGPPVLYTRVHGSGGDAGNAPHTGGRSAASVIGGSAASSIRSGTEGKIPGGGGGASYGQKGYNGGNGMVVIYY